MRRLVGCVAVLVTACNGAGNTAAHVALQGGAVARVGDDVVPVAVVAAVAAARHVYPSRAADLVVDDAVAAYGARAAGLGERPGVRLQTDQALARATLARLKAKARAAGPPTDAEVDELALERWREVDLPEARRVVQAVVLLDGRAPPDADGRALAERIAAAVREATGAADFETRANAVAPGGRKVEVGFVAPFFPDAHYSESEGVVVPEFATATFALSAIGDTSAVFDTKHGHHVIRLVERVPGRLVPPEQRRAYFGEDLYTRRARRELEDLLRAAKQERSVEISPAAETLTADLVRKLAAD